MTRTPIRVLLVEDDAEDARLFQAMLAHEARNEFHLTRVGRLAEALEKLTFHCYDLVLSDLGLPDSQGLPTFVSLKSKAPMLPIVVLSGQDDEEFAVSAMQEGAQDYLVKSQVTGQLLARSLRYAIERKRIESERDRLIDERRSAEEALFHTRAQLLDAIESLDAGLVMYSPDEKMVVCNENYKQLYAPVAHMMVPGTPYEDILRALFTAGALTHSGLSESEWIGERLAAHRNPGQASEQQVSGRWIRISDRRTSNGGVVSLWTDITDLKNAQAAAEAASRAKGDFLANMSHEIRTPMHGVLGMLDLALRSSFPTRQREFLILAKSSAEALLRLLNDILDFSKIEAGRLELESTAFSLRETFGDTLKTLALQVQEKGLELSHSVAADVPDALLGDPGRLSQILVNLIGNAGKFTERGEVAVRIELVSRDEAIIGLHVSVRDTGIGISQERQAHIFAAFTQADSSTTREFGGTGLGLTICAHLVQAMGGCIWVESAVGQGSTFHFTVRLGLENGAPARPAPGRAGLDGLPVLVVDDNATHRLIIGELVAEWGMKPTAVDGGPAAIAAMRHAHKAGVPYCLVLLDVLMPGMDGFEVAEWIQRDAELAGTAIMMLSSAEHAGEADRCRAVGAAAFLRKPIKESELLDTILEVLGLAAAPARDGSPAADTHTRPPPSVKLRILLAEDTPVNQLLAIALLEERGHAVVVANDGREALDILEYEAFDVILMDVQMPRMDGFATTAAIRAGEAGTGRRVPILAMTAHAMKGDRERCLAAGMDGYISKPIRAEQFLATIEQPFAAAAGTDVSQEARPDSPAMVFDLPKALARARGKRPLLRKMAELFVADCPGLLDQMRAALAAGDASMLERAAHRMKGSAANLNASRVVDVAGRLEEFGCDGQFDGVGAAHAELEDELVHLGRALETLIDEGAARET